MIDWPFFCNVGYLCVPQPRSSKFLADPIHVTSEVIPRYFAD